MFATTGLTRADQIITNGTFETGDLSGWTVVNETGFGSWSIQSGTSSPSIGFSVPPPPEGMYAAMTDEFGPESTIMYQDFVVPTTVTSAILSFDLYINNHAGNFFSPASLSTADFPNQQMRIDITTSSADPFSVDPADVLQNIYQTMPGDPAVSGYTSISTDLTSLLSSYLGETLRLRFAQVETEYFFNTGVDEVSLAVRSVPEPSSLAMFGLGGLTVFGLYRRRKKTA